MSNWGGKRKGSGRPRKKKSKKKNKTFLGIRMTEEEKDEFQSILDDYIELEGSRTNAIKKLIKIGGLKMKEIIAFRDELEKIENGELEKEIKMSSNDLEIKGFDITQEATGDDTPDNALDFYYKANYVDIEKETGKKVKGTVIIMQTLEYTEEDFKKFAGKGIDVDEFYDPNISSKKGVIELMSVDEEYVE